MENLTIRLETEKNYRAVEELTREAFWNVYKPGADEHYFVHQMRNHPDFIPELAFVLELDGRQLYVGTGAVLVDSTYSVSLGKTYAEVLRDLAENDLMDIFRAVTEGKRIDNGL